MGFLWGFIAVNISGLILLLVWFIALSKLPGQLQPNKQNVADRYQLGFMSQGLVYHHRQARRHICGVSRLSNYRCQEENSKWRSFSVMLHIRDYIPNDLEGLKICLIALQKVEQEFSPLVADGHLIADAYFSELVHRTRAEGGKIIVAEHDNQIAGYVAIQSRVKADKIHEIDYEYAYISDLVVLPEYRGLGYGRALLDEAIEFAKSQKAKLIRIGVAAQNTLANKLYVENGFEPIAIIMEKTL